MRTIAELKTTPPHHMNATELRRFAAHAASELGAQPLSDLWGSSLENDGHDFNQFFNGIFNN